MLKEVTYLMAGGSPSQEVCVSLIHILFSAMVGYFFDEIVCLLGVGINSHFSLQFQKVYFVGQQSI